MTPTDTKAALEALSKHLRIMKGVVEVAQKDCLDNSVYDFFTHQLQRFDQAIEQVAALKSAGESKWLQHEVDSTRGLWCVDKDPKECTLEWIRENCFQLGSVESPTDKTVCSKGAVCEEVTNRSRLDSMERQHPPAHEDKE